MRMASRLATLESLHSAPETEKTVIFVGHARLPQSLAPRDSSSVISVELETEMPSGAVTGVSVKGALPLAAKLLEEVLAGQNIQDGPGDAINAVRKRYVCPSQKALCTALANAYDAYLRYRQQGARSV
jgi:hypothetical protein